jgi:hypothetical protein
VAGNPQVCGEIIIPVQNNENDLNYGPFFEFLLIPLNLW